MTVRPRIESLEDRNLLSNDLFTDAVVLTGTDVTVTASNVGYTLEGGEPSHEGWWPPATGATAWWVWTAPQKGAVRIDLAGTAVDHFLDVYTGVAVDQLTRVASAQGYGSWYPYSGHAQVVLDVQAGQTYRIAVDGAYGQTGDISLHLTLPPRPANDDFADRIPLTGDLVTATGTNIGATSEAGEPTYPPWAGRSPSVWWSWIATSDGSVQVDTDGSDFWTTLGVYTGDAVDQLIFRAQATSFLLPDGTVDGAIARLSVRAGTTYQIAVSSMGLQEGAIQLRVEWQPAPANDDFADAIELFGESVQVTGHNFGATGEASEPNHGGSALDPVTNELESVWWKWTAPRSGRVFVQDLGNTRPSIGVYTGSSVDALTEVAASADPSDPYANPFAPISFRVEAGVTYFLAVDGLYGYATSYFLDLNYAPPNDDFANAQVLDTSANPVLHVTGTTRNASGEPGEPNPFEGWFPPQEPASVWYQWTPAASGPFLLQYTAPDFPTPGIWAQVFTGSLADNSLLGVSGTDADGALFFEATAGVTYHIRVLPVFFAPPGPFDFTLFDATRPGVWLDGGTLYVAGTAAADRVIVSPPTTGTVRDGSTGVEVKATLNRRYRVHTFTEPITAARILTGGGNDDVLLEKRLAFPTLIALGDGHDTLKSGAGRDVVLGDPGWGSTGNDRIETRDGDDFVSDYGGDNVIDAGGGANWVDTGPGNDTAIGGAGDDFFNLGEGNNRVTTGDGTNTVVAYVGTNTVVGGAGPDVVYGGDGDDYVLAGDGDNQLYLGGGNNYVRSGSGNDYIDAYGSTDGNNDIDAGAGSNFVNTGWGDDTIRTGSDNDWVSAGEGNNRVETGAGDDVVMTFAGNDTVLAGDGTDSVYDFGGNNDLDLGAGNDTFVLDGTVWDYTVYPPTTTLGNGRNVVRAGAGDDWVQISNNAGRNNVSAGDGHDYVQVTHGTNVVTGGLGVDVLVGGVGSDILDGGEDDDLLVGGAGSDFLNGGTGNDLLFAGSLEVPYEGFHRELLTAWRAASGFAGTYDSLRGWLTREDGTSRHQDDGSLDVLVGGAGLDWFWATDLVTFLDRTATEERN